MSYKEKISEFLEIVNRENKEEICKTFSNLKPPDIAEIINEITSLDKQLLIVKSLETSIIARAFSRVSYDRQINILKNLSLEESLKLFKEMPLDESADLLNVIDDREFAQKIIDNLNIKTQKDLEKIIDLDETSAGGIMTPELCALPAKMTTKQALNIIVNSKLKDAITTVFVIIPENRTLVGVISLIELISSSESKKLRELANTNYHYVNVDTNKEEVALLFRKYKLLVIPVVNEKHQIIGRITVDDILNISYEEAEEDMAMMSGTPDILLHKQPLRKIILLRSPWLILNLILAVINCLVIEKMNFQSSVILVTCIPLIMAMAGNTGVQSATVMIREIALGFHKQSFLKIALREIISGSSLGIICGLLGSLLILFLISFSNIDTGVISKSSLALLIFMSTIFTMGFSSFFGSFVSIVLYKISIDPALAAGPFITTLNDIISSVIYFLTFYMLIEYIL